MDKRILENVRECRKNYREYISSRYNILEKIKDVTDEKSWTDTVYTDGKNRGRVKIIAEYIEFKPFIKKD